jgi:hypothetical protein
MSDPSKKEPKSPRPGETTGIFRRLEDEPYATETDREELIAILARHVGPLARVLVQRLDGTRLTRNDLFMAAAQELEDDSVREQFMKETGLYR